LVAYFRVCLAPHHTYSYHTDCSRFGHAHRKNKWCKCQFSPQLTSVASFSLSQTLATRQLACLAVICNQADSYWALLRLLGSKIWAKDILLQPTLG
jgi:hypothetical protein